jgi:GTP-binding protein
MKIKSAEFAHCVGLPSQLPGPLLPEVAFAGRSNVGKSSLINTLINRKAWPAPVASPAKPRL